MAPIVKNVASILTLAAIGAGSAYANVVSSGAWSANSTWSEGTAPTTSSSSPYTDFSFATSGINLEVDSKQYADRIQLGSTADTTITIDSHQRRAVLLYFRKQPGQQTDFHRRRRIGSIENKRNALSDGANRMGCKCYMHDGLVLSAQQHPRQPIFPHNK